MHVAAPNTSRKQDAASGLQHFLGGNGAPSSLAPRSAGLGRLPRLVISAPTVAVLTFLSVCVMLLALGSPASAQAVGGTETEILVGGTTYRVHTFTSGGTLTVTSPIPNAEYLIVAGGGGGGEGGGGAGGMLTGSVALTSGASYTVTVGAGGVGNGGSGGAGTAANGGNSSITGGILSGLIAIGGGGGAFGSTVDTANGGSGGGGSFDRPTATVALGTAGQGNPGGISNREGYGASGGGGGAGGAGGNATSVTAGSGGGGNGGAGLASSITGSSVFYAGGGGGGANTNSTPVPGTGLGGLGGGGNGATTHMGSGSNGADGLGGGGGGSDPDGGNGGNGGSGIVVVRYAKPPQANAGPDKTVGSASIVTLDGGGTSFNANPALTYAWTQTAGTAVTLSSATDSQPTFTAPTLAFGDAAATLTFSLIVTDNLGLASAADTVTITVTAPGNQQATANAGPDQSVASAASVTLDGSASSDPDAGQTLTYAWTQTAGTAVTLSSATDSQPTFTAPTLAFGDAAATLTFSLIVTDNLGLASAADNVTITVATPGNQQATANAGPDQSVASAASVTLDGSASSDPDAGQTLTYAWTQTAGTAVTLSSATDSQPTFTAPTLAFGDAAATLTFSLIVTDNLGLASAADNVTITVATPGNQQPTANAGPDQSVASDASVTLDGSASSDPDAGQTLTYAWTQTAGTAVTLSSATASQPTFTAPTLALGDAAATLTFSLVVTDNLGQVSAADNVTITVATPGNQQPTANAGPDQSVASDASVTLDGSASSDPDAGQTLTYAWTQTAGTAVTLSSATASQPTFTAPTLALGDAAATLTFSLIVTDNLGLASVADTVTITVTTPANQQATANAGPDQTIASAASVAVAASAITVTLDGSASSDPDPGQRLSYQWAQTAGAAVTLSSATASQPTFTAPTIKVGEPNATITFSLVVTDSLGLASAADTVTITVTAPGHADGERTKVAANVTTAEALPADDATEAEITVSLYDETGNVLSAGGNIVIATTDMGTLRQNPQGTSIPMRDNRNGTYTVWLRSDSVGIATVTITVDDVASGSVRIFFAKSAVNVITETETAILGFMLNRANRVVSSQPNLTRFLNEKRCGHFNAAGDDFGGSMDGCVQKGNLWYDMTASWGHGTRFMQGTVGAHMVITPNFLLGGIIQFDETKDDAARIGGKGWMAGPYFAARLPEQPLFFEGRFLYGKSDNSINPLGFYTDAFQTERWLGQFKMEGEVRTDQMTLRPSLSVQHMDEHSKSYTDTPGNTISSQSASVTRVSAGVEFEVPVLVDIGHLDLTGGASANYTASEGGSSDIEGGSARIHLGIDWAVDQRLSFQAGVFQDGIGSQQNNYGANVQLSIRF